LRLFFGEEDLSSYAGRIPQNSDLPMGLTLPYHQNHLTFDFIGISLTIPSKVKYQFKLEGFDEDWSPTTREASMTYSNLSPGAFTFKVKATNSDGLWNNQPTTYSFLITPPFWHTWWFYILCVVATTSSLYGFYKVRVKTLEREQEVLENMVMLRTSQLEESQAHVVELEKEATERQMSGGFAHEMRNALAGSQLVMSKALGVDGPEPHVSLNLVNNKRLEDLYDFLKHHLGDDDLKQSLGFMKVIFSNGERLDDILQIINRATSRGLSITQQIMDYSRIGQGHIDSVPIHIDGIVGRMMDEMRDEFEEKGIVTKINLQSETGIKGDETHFYSMIENIVFNARDALIGKTLAEGEDRLIEVNDESTPSHYTLRISDNGAGISEENKEIFFDTFFSTKPETGTGLGLGMVKKTVAMYGGVIEVESELHKGTTFTLVFPLESQVETAEAT
jgi:signal transduction histidine kinase